MTVHGVKPPVRLHIEQLVLHGFDRRDRHAIAEAVRAEVAAVLAGQHITRGATVEHIDGGEVLTGSVRDTKSVGQAVGRAVRGGLSR
jgi:hypothetical protein